MSETETTNHADARDSRDANSVWFLSGVQPAPKGLAELQKGVVGDVISRKLADVQQDWAVINQQIILILGNSEAHSEKTGFQLDEVSVEVGVTAKGQLAFMAEAGMSATFKLTFRRK